MNSLFGALLLILTLMVSGMALYINMSLMLYGASIVAFNSIASILFVLSWLALSVYSITNHGEYSPLLRFYWFMALLGAAFSVITISGMTRILEYAAYLLLFFLTPLFGLRLYPMTHLTWAIVLAGIAFLFIIMAMIAASRRSRLYREEDDLYDDEQGGDTDDAQEEDEQVVSMLGEGLSEQEMDSVSDIVSEFEAASEAAVPEPEAASLNPELEPETASPDSVSDASSEPEPAPEPVPVLEPPTASDADSAQNATPEPKVASLDPEPASDTASQDSISDAVSAPEPEAAPAQDADPIVPETQAYERESSFSPRGRSRRS